MKKSTNLNSVNVEAIRSCY